MFSKTCEYAIKAMLFIQSNNGSGRKINLQEIADGIDSPLAFTAKILQKLRKNGLLQSTIGAKGGFVVREGEKIYLIDIVKAIDGEGIFTNCVLGLPKCSCENPCPVHEKYIQVKEDLIKTVLESSLDDLLDQINVKKIVLK
ncbi:MAG: Rrf2 family transcriptional regulator [Bacteroidota bacterium]